MNYSNQPLNTQGSPSQAKTFADLFHNEVTAWLVLGLSVCITVFGWYVSDKYIKTRANEAFKFEVEDARLRIVSRMASYEQALRGGVALIDSNEGLTRENWKNYVSTLSLNDVLPGIQGFGYAVMLKPEEVAPFEAKVRAEGFPNFSVRPEGKREQYSSIVYLEPFDFRNRRAFGYDMYSESTRRAAMDEAAKTGESAVSGLVKLVQETETDVQAGFLMYLPVYRNDMPIYTPEQRQAAIKGFVYSPFRAKDLMIGVLGNNAIPLTFQLFDGLSSKPEHRLYDSRDLGNNQVGGSSPNYKPAFEDQTTVQLPGRTWTVVFQSTEIFDRGADGVQPEVILWAGGVIDITLFLVISSLARQRRQLRAKNDQMAISEGRYHSMVNGLRDQFAFFSLSAEGRLVYQSPSLLQFLQLKQIHEDEFFMQSLAANPENIAAKDALTKARENMIPVAFRLDRNEVNVRLGSPVSIDGFVSPVVGPEGNLLSIEGALQDVSDRRESERQLNEYKSRLENLVQERTTRLEEAYERLKVNDRRLQVLIELNQSYIDKGKSVLVYKSLEMVGSLFGANRTFLLELDGLWQPVQLHFHDQNGPVLLPDSHNREHLFSWLQHLQSVLLAESPYRRNRSVTFDDLKDLRLFQTLDNCLISTSRGDHERIFVLGMGNKAKGFSDQDEHQCQLFVEDLSRLVLKIEAVETLEYAKLNAEVASQAKSHFLANISHEVRTPLNAILGLNAVVRDRIVDPEHLQMLDQIEKSSSQLLEILDNILDYSNIHAGGLTLDESEFSPAEIVQNVVKSYSTLPEAAKMDWKLDIEDGFPDKYYGDPVRFEQIIDNLVSNACKFSGRGLVSVALEEVARQDDESILRLQVEDEGTGFDLKNLDSLLEPFEQADNSETRRFGGIGLGLAITNRLVDLMGGKMSIRSEPGKGSHFTCTLRLKLKTVEVPAVSTQSPTQAPDLQSYKERLAGKHVLVVEDNPLNQQVIIALLKRVGITVTLAEDGQKGLLSFAENNEFDLILMDLHMPVMDGVEATEAIRSLNVKNAQTVPVIALTACAFEDDRKRALRAGMNAYLTKPVNATLLYQTLDEFTNPDLTVGAAE